MVDLSHLSPFDTTMSVFAVFGAVLSIVGVLLAVNVSKLERQVAQRAHAQFEAEVADVAKFLDDEETEKNEDLVAELAAHLPVMDPRQGNLSNSISKQAFYEGLGMNWHAGGQAIDDVASIQILAQRAVNAARAAEAIARVTSPPYSEARAVLSRARGQTQT